MDYISLKHFPFPEQLRVDNDTQVNQMWKWFCACQMCQAYDRHIMDANDN